MVDPKDIDIISSEIENRLDDLFGETDLQLTNGEADLQLTNTTKKNPAEDYPLTELKNLILSIDWEITDEVLDNLLLQLKDLQLSYQHDKIVITFLQILSSLGNYIRTHRAKAPSKTFRILNSVFSSLDKVVLSKDMTEAAKKKILRAEMNRYKDLRTLIDKSKTVDAKRKAEKVAAKRKANAVEAEAPEKKEKKKEPILTLDEPFATLELEEKEEETVTLLDESFEPPAKAAKEDLPVTHPESEQKQPTVATLADAVAEIKQYIHTEIKALKAEIQSLREQK